MAEDQVQIQGTNQEAGTNGEATSVMLEMMKQMLEMQKQITQLSQMVVVQKVSAGNGKSFGAVGGGRKEPKPVLDTRTGEIYRTEASAGKAVCKEYPGLKENNWVWFSIPDTDKRFIQLQGKSEEEVKKLQAEVKAKLEAQRPQVPQTQVQTQRNK